MNVALLVVALGSVGQYGYAGLGSGIGYGYGYGLGYGNGLGYGYGYGAYGIPRPAYDPIGYYRYYNGAGFYTLPRTPVFPPKVITIRPGLMDRPGVTGRVVGLDERARTITLRLPAETVAVRYGPGTRFQSLDADEFPEIRAGAIVNVDGATITVLRKAEG